MDPNRYQQTNKRKNMGSEFLLLVGLGVMIFLMVVAPAVSNYFNAIGEARLIEARALECNQKKTGFPSSKYVRE